jgi:uncharacterized protein YdeI (YjbR/CyaY-like superfamily)
LAHGLEAVHPLPDDLATALAAVSSTAERWNAITPLARNEWICWAISVKQETTRQNHIQRVCAELNAGKRRPCCWPGCPHRTKT